MNKAVHPPLRRSAFATGDEGGIISMASFISMAQDACHHFYSAQNGKTVQYEKIKSTRLNPTEQSTHIYVRTHVAILTHCSSICTYRYFSIDKMQAPLHSC